MRNKKLALTNKVLADKVRQKQRAAIEKHAPNSFLTERLVVIGAWEDELDKLMQAVSDRRVGSTFDGIKKYVDGNPPSAGAVVLLIDIARKSAIQEHASEIGKAGISKRHTPMKELKAWAIIQYQSGSWPSANKAAHDLKEKVLMHGRTIGAHLSVENAQRTIAEWIRKSA